MDLVDANKVNLGEVWLAQQILERLGLQLLRRHKQQVNLSLKNGLDHLDPCFSLQKSTKKSVI